MEQRSQRRNSSSKESAFETVGASTSAEATVDKTARQPSHLITREGWLRGLATGDTCSCGVERLEMDRARQRYDGADDVNNARACAARASVPPLSVFPRMTST
jgi:hypothetical protein